MPGTVIVVLISILQVGLFALIAPAIWGIVRWLKARLQLRKGPPPWQPYLDIIKLLRIPSDTRLETTSWVYGVAPLIVFVSYGLLCMATPPFFYRLPGAITIDILTVVYLLGLARFALALAGMDTGTPFGGMGSSREMFINVLAEPVLILIILELTFSSHSTNLPQILASFHSNNADLIFNITALLLIWFALAFVALMDNGLLPVDNPTTHLELTMIQKALHLEYWGRNLALIEWGEAMRLLFFLTLLIGLLIPQGVAQLPGGGLIVGLLYIVMLLFIIGILAFVQTILIKMRLGRLVIPWAAVLLLAGAAVFIVFFQ